MPTLQCTDNIVEVADGDFDAFLYFGPCLRRLFVGGGGFKEGECDRMVLKRLGISTSAFMTILACIRQNKHSLPLDRATAASIASGDVRHAVLALGGMPEVEEALDKYEFERSKLNEANKHLPCDPQYDLNFEFEWRDLVYDFGITSTSNFHEMRTTVHSLSEEGFVYAGLIGLHKDVRVVRFRRHKATWQAEQRGRMRPRDEEGISEDSA